MNLADSKEALVVFQTSQGFELRGSLLRLSPHQITFEAYSTLTVLRLSEVLDEFRIFAGGQLLYTGKAVLTNLIHSGVTLICQATLKEAWVNPGLVYAGLSTERLQAEFDGFFVDWQKHFLLRSEYRLFVSELYSFFQDLRLWLEHVELGLRGSPSGDSHKQELDFAQQLAPRALSVFNEFVDRFEEIARPLEEAGVAAHQNYLRRQLHPLLLSAPWVYRTVMKPLGYAGDYEMVSMMFRQPLEGASLFAKIVNYCFLEQGAVRAHRNRVDYLVEKLISENLRAARAGQDFRVLVIGSGPAIEIQRFLSCMPAGTPAYFDLLDFDAEALQHAGRAVAAASSDNGQSSVSVRLVKKSVASMIKESARSAPESDGAQYHLIYCAGLFDYLTDQVCRRIMDVGFKWLAPGGLLLATNVTPSNPCRFGMEHMLDWSLIYRDASRMRLLRPAAEPQEVEIKSDYTGVNVWIEVRKPTND